ncbi:DeoR/GlpR transcriptional regulator [Rhizobium sp. KVB221]|uniref:DeoR/GlpR transcriptional regulator n=1 Tax=Rhizobium setariae TaxID=2801340 RepID=A0A937CN04_9HYPH|nr:DeoR/GlpR family DNA-binding transcription regulator [Rhizobium setariae]MBL0374930.1 DeoR/GlpR transcriptional regulator [Rhizobium setariae]
MSATEYLLHERQSLIRKRLADDGRVIAADLAQQFAISEDTIRRDLREMAAAGLLKRVYGGALPVQSTDDNSILSRMSIKPERKDALAKAAVNRISAGMTLFIDAGTTNLAIAQAIPPGLKLTVITNAPLIAAALMDRPDIAVVVIGGQLDRGSGAVLGSKAIQDAANFNPDLCILGSCGFEVDRGVTASFPEEAEFKRFIALRSRSVMAAVTNDKLGVPAPCAVIPMEKCDHVVIEQDADPHYAEAIARAGANVIRAGGYQTGGK